MPTPDPLNRLMSPDWAEALEPQMTEPKDLQVTHNRHNSGYHTSAAEKIEYELGFDLFVTRLLSRG